MTPAAVHAWRADDVAAVPETNVFLPDDFDAYIPAARWDVFRAAIRCAEAAGIRAAIGGGLAVSLLTGMWRAPHDLDLLVTPADRAAMIRILTEARFADYYDREPYDRSWIYRAVRNDVVVDTIWGFANGVADVDDAWIECGVRADLGGVTIRLVPVEELIWSKLYVVQGTRCDWPEIVNLLVAAAERMNWNRLISRCAGDETLLASVLTLFAWVAPGRAQSVPESVWQRLNLARPTERSPIVSRERIDRLDSRVWFSPALLEQALVREAR